jgi:hypothetical protein
MKTRTTLLLAVIAVGVAQCARAQDPMTGSRLNTNFGMGVTAPLNPVAQFVGSSVDVVAGVGYNFDSHHSFVGQFMWNGLPPNRNAFRPIWVAAKARDISGSSSLMALTANYRFQMQGHVFGAYAIGGGGWYYRRAAISREIVVGAGTACAPNWLYWGYSCVSGTISEDQTLVSAGSSAFGANGGVGFTIRINDEGYKFYVESRYHYAPTKNISTQLVAITLGFSW